MGSGQLEVSGYKIQATGNGGGLMLKGERIHYIAGTYFAGEVRLR
jgi:hypothetical protein